MHVGLRGSAGQHPLLSSRRAAGVNSFLAVTPREAPRAWLFNLAELAEGGADHYVQKTEPNERTDAKTARWIIVMSGVRYHTTVCVSRRIGREMKRTTVLCGEEELCSERPLDLHHQAQTHGSQNQIRIMDADAYARALLEH